MVKGRIIKSCRCSIFPKIGGKTSGRANTQTCGKTCGATNKKWQNHRATQKLWQNQWTTKHKGQNQRAPQKKAATPVGPTNPVGNKYQRQHQRAQNHSGKTSEVKTNQWQNQ
jgi:hypothetical protein